MTIGTRARSVDHDQRRADLRKRVAPWRRAHDTAQALTPDRDQAILDALAAGMSMRAAAAETGLTVGRIGQIAARARETGA